MTQQTVPTVIEPVTKHTLETSLSPSQAEQLAQTIIDELTPAKAVRRRRRCTPS